MNLVSHEPKPPSNEAVKKRNVGIRMMDEEVDDGSGGFQKMEKGIRIYWAGDG